MQKLFFGFVFVHLFTFAFTAEASERLARCVYTVGVTSEVFDGPSSVTVTNFVDPSTNPNDFLTVAKIVVGGVVQYTRTTGYNSGTHYTLTYVDLQAGENAFKRLLKEYKLQGRSTSK